jgi:Tol biopolymer transport system component
VGRTHPGLNIFTVRPDGTHRRQLTDSGRALDPRYDATGQRIVYESSGDIWVMDADGTDQTALITSKAYERRPGWSPDGRWVVYTSDESGSTQIHVFQLSSGETTQLTFAGSAMRSANSPVWSPDGTRIAFIGRVPSGLPDGTEPYYKFWDVLMTVLPDGTDLRKLTNDYFAYKPDWTPNSNRILYSRFGDGNESDNPCPTPTYSIRPDGTGREPVTHGWCHMEWGGIRSPEGRHMAVLRDANWMTYPSLYVTDADGRNPVQIAADMPIPARGFDWQP